ncbi:MAG: hypothetical protein AAF989_07540, partial [Planctomycetota bacterium]
VLVIDGKLSDDMQQSLVSMAISMGISRVISFDTHGRGDCLIHEDALLPELGQRASDLMCDAEMILGVQHHSQRSERSVGTREHLAFHFLFDSKGGMIAGDSFASGLPLRKGHFLDVDLPSASRRTVQLAQARTNLRLRVEKLLHPRAEASSNGSTSAHDQSLSPEDAIDALLSQTDPSDHMRLLWTISESTRRARRAWFDRHPSSSGNESRQTAKRLQEVERTLLDRVASRFQEHSWGKWASVRRSALQHSDERRRLRSLALANNEPIPLSSNNNQADTPAVSPFQVTPQSDLPDSSQAIRPVSHSTALSRFHVDRNTVHGHAKLGTLWTPGTLQHEDDADVVRNPGGEIESGGEVDLQWEFHPLVLLHRAHLQRNQLKTLPKAERESQEDAVTDSGSPGSVNRLPPPSTPDPPSLRPTPPSVRTSDSDGGHSLASGSPAIQRLTTMRVGPWGVMLDPESATSLRAPRATSPPRLDGQTNDPCWQQTSAQSFPGDVSLRVCYDDEFVYFAVSVPAHVLAKNATDAHRNQEERLAQPASEVKRIRDHALEHEDRICLRLDTDQDAQTCYEISVTGDRRSRDCIDGNPAWQPTYYFALNSEREATEGFTRHPDGASAPPAANDFEMEIAILRSDLGEQKMSDWFISASWLSAGQNSFSTMLDPTQWSTLGFEPR